MNGKMLFFGLPFVLPPSPVAQGQQQQTGTAKDHLLPVAGRPRPSRPCRGVGQASQSRDKKRVRHRSQQHPVTPRAPQSRGTPHPRKRGQLRVEKSFRYIFEDV